MDKPQLKICIVHIQWSDGIGSLSIGAYPDEKIAVAQSAAGATRCQPPPTGDVSAVTYAVVELGAIKQMMRHVEKGGAADVVSLRVVEPASVAMPLQSGEPGAEPAADVDPPEGRGGDGKAIEDAVRGVPRLDDGLPDAG